MPNHHKKSNVPNYSIRSSVKTLGCYQVNYVGKFGTEELEQPEFTTKKLNHNASHLTDASPRFPVMTHQEVIRRAQAGELGTTEVPKNQVW